MSKVAVRKNLNRWFKEKWVDVSRKDPKTGKHPPCGRSKAKKGRKGYPKCRPSVRVSSKTPKTSGEMTSGQKRAATKRKRAKRQGVGGKPTIVKRDMSHCNCNAPQGFSCKAHCRSKEMKKSVLVKSPVSPEAKRHKLEYDKKYESTPERVKYRSELRRERRHRGIDGKGGPDMSHTKDHTLVAEDPHSNRARHFKERGTLKSDVRQDPDRVEKFLGGAFGVAGATTGAGGRFGYLQDAREGDGVAIPLTGQEVVFDPAFHSNAKIQDPFTGGLIYERDIGSSPLARVVGGGVGALQFFNPILGLGYLGRGTKAAGTGIRTSDRVSDTVRGVDGMTGAVDRTAGPMQVLGQGAGRRIEGAGSGLERFAGSRRARIAGRIPQAIGLGTEHFGAGGASLAAAAGLNLLNRFGQDDDESGFGQQGQTQGFGSGGLGINDISNVQSNAVAGRQIFNPGAYRDDPRAVSFEQQREFGGFGMTKGENMFVNNTGEEIRKQVEELMDKAHCTSELKADEDKKGKKPAHGMVIVIGSKAGPGPSKNGKRQKLDSEKKED